MFAPPPIYMPPTPEELELYNKGFTDCLNTLERKVKKLGKKYHKEFLEELSELGGRYVSFSATASSHKCNCEYCSINK